MKTLTKRTTTYDKSWYARHSNDLVSAEQQTNLVDMKLRPPTINWSAIGSVSLDEAEAFAHAILECVKFARENTIKD